MPRKHAEPQAALAAAVTAARAAGLIMRQNLRAGKRINAATQHDIKLELDVRCQKRIEGILRRKFPDVPVLGEEGDSGDLTGATRWVVDPIDGTVNFAYGIPHACVSIAFQVARETRGTGTGAPDRAEPYETVAGVVYDPFQNELWTARRGGAARLNGRIIRVSRRERLSESIVSIGFAKNRGTLRRMVPTFNQLLYRVRKIRIMGAAALAMVYVASGRFDAYIEYGLRLWDIAAGGLIIECAGGEFWRQPVPGSHSFQIIANNGRMRGSLQRLTGRTRRLSTQREQ